MVREVYDAYKRFDGQPIAVEPGAMPDMSEDIADLLDNVVETYGQFTAGTLRGMTHRETPWSLAYQRGENTEITPQVMERFFRSRLQSAPTARLSWKQALANPRFRRSVDRGLADVSTGETVSWSEIERSLPSS